MADMMLLKGQTLGLLETYFGMQTLSCGMLKENDNVDDIS